MKAQSLATIGKMQGGAIHFEVEVHKVFINASLDYNGVRPRTLRSVRLHPYRQLTTGIGGKRCRFTRQIWCPGEPLSPRSLYSRADVSVVIFSIAARRDNRAILQP